MCTYMLTSLLVCYLVFLRVSPYRLDSRLPLTLPSFFLLQMYIRRKEAYPGGGDRDQRLDRRKFHPGLTPKVAHRGGSMRVLTLPAEMEVVGLVMALKIDGLPLPSILTPHCPLIRKSETGGRRGACGWEGGMTILSMMMGLGGQGTTQRRSTKGIDHLHGAVASWEGGTAMMAGLTGGMTGGLLGMGQAPGGTEEALEKIGVGVG